MELEEFEKMEKEEIKIKFVYNDTKLNKLIKKQIANLRNKKEKMK